MPPRISAPPTIFWSSVMLLSPIVFATSTPTSESGAEPRSIQEREPRVHRAEHAVAHRAERLEDRAVEDVGADRDLRVEAEEQDQDRRHQAAAAHPGHADEDPDEEPRERELPGHAPVLGGKRAGDERPAGEPAAELVRLAAGAEAGDRGEQRERGDEQAERDPERREPGGVGERGRGEHGEADHVRDARRARVLERPLAEARLDQLEVGEARQAPAAAEREPERELEREQREQPPPAGRDRDDREHPDHASG